MQTNYPAHIVSILSTTFVKEPCELFILNCTIFSKQICLALSPSLTFLVIHVHIKEKVLWELDIVSMFEECYADAMESA